MCLSVRVRASVCLTCSLTCRITCRSVCVTCRRITCRQIRPTACRSLACALSAHLGDLLVLSLHIYLSPPPSLSRSGSVSLFAPSAFRVNSLFQVALACEVRYQPLRAAGNIGNLGNLGSISQNSCPVRSSLSLLLCFLVCLCVATVLSGVSLCCYCAF